MLRERLSTFADKISRDEIFSQAAALAYYTTFAMAPLMILTVTVLAALKLSLQEQLLQQIRDLVGEQASTVLASVIDSAENRPDLSSFAGWAGALVLLFSASVVFGQLQTTLNVIFRVKAEEKANGSVFQTIWGLVSKRLLTMGMLLTFVFFAIVSLAVSAALSFLLTRYEIPWANYVSAPLNLAIFTALFGMIYKWMPDRRGKTSVSFAGGALTAGLFVIGKALIGQYIGQAAVGSAYGAAGSLAVLLAWFYYSSLIFFLGAEVSAFFLVKDELPDSSKALASQSVSGAST